MSCPSRNMSGINWRASPFILKYKNMSEDILAKIVRMRKADIERLGLNFGIEIPEKRRVGHTEFLGNAGAILEVKRASPSKGDIAPDLDPVGLATIYAEAHAQAVSVLTEGNFFKGSLRDLIAVTDLMEKRRQQGLHACAVLRKDFLLYEDEIDVAFRCGADAVLLIARILDDEQLVRMAKRAQSFDIQAFVEVREKDDFRKLSVVTSALGADAAKTIVAGVNSRDLATFHTDPLIPASVRSKLPAKAVFESGVHTPADADYARSLGFTGILVGEAVAKNPALAKDVVSAFESGRENARGGFWRKFAALWQAQRTNPGPFKVGGVRQAHQPFAEPLHRNRPLVKICGITRVEDGMLAAELGADMLGFVFSTTKRLTTEEFVTSFSTKLRAGGNPVPLLVGVITDPESPEGKTAIKLVREGVLDAVQLHGIEPTKSLELADDKVPELVEGTNKIGIPYYCAARIGEESDFDKVAALRAKGEPRILLDAKVEGIPGGTGKTIPENLLREKAGDIPLWLAGGITPTNVAELVGKFSPELIDVSSGVEDAPGIKNSEKLKALFAAFTSH